MKDIKVKSLTTKSYSLSPFQEKLRAIYIKHETGYGLNYEDFEPELFELIKKEIIGFDANFGGNPSDDFIAGYNLAKEEQRKKL